MLTEVTWQNDGKVVVDLFTSLKTFNNQEQAHTWLAWQGYKIVQKTPRNQGDYISGFYVQR